jgi:isoleucyl-tRNA synthetase
MDITFQLDGVEMRHIGKVLDCWFESGSMPFAQFHYPFENKEKFESMFPADFIIEAIDQTRGWFYSLTAVNVALFGKAPWKNLICTGFVMASDGRKLSKKHKNYTDPIELMDKVSADAYRYLLMSSPLSVGENFVMNDKALGDVARKLGMVWNMYDFFTMYAEVDGWEYDGDLKDPLDSLENPLDIWVVSRLHQLVAEVEERTEAYDLQAALRPVLPFIDDASNWYVRRSRRRFWKAEDDTDKAKAYTTLHYVLTRLSYLLAPFAPYMAEELYHNMTGDAESIHLKDWLSAGKVNEQVMSEMDQVRDYVNQGLAIRAKAGIKVRQPLASVTVPATGTVFDFAPILQDELNVKSVIVGKDVQLDTEITDDLQREGLARELIRQVQITRKAAELQVNDRIELCIISTSTEVNQAVEQYRQIIQDETLATTLSSTRPTTHKSAVWVNGFDVELSLAKV